MNYNKIFLFSLLFIICCSCGSRSSKQESRDLSESKPQADRVEVPEFDGMKAYEYVRLQTEFGPRVVNSDAHKKCGIFLEQEMKKYADTVIVQQMQVRTYNNQILDAKNIISVINPDANQRILLAAHWDSRPYGDYDSDEKKRLQPISGANDGASGVGVLMEIARVLHHKRPEIGVDIIFFDAEDYGAPHFVHSTQENDWGLGSQFWSKNPHRRNYTARFGILLDMIGAENARFPREMFSRQYANDVLNKVWDMAAKLGYGHYFVQEIGTAVIDDHYYVNKIMQIPMIDIIHLDDHSANKVFFDHWHTSDDTIDKISATTLGVVGEVVLHIIYGER